MANYTKNICVDFDGVIHNYDGVWKGIDVVAGPPVDGAIEWLQMMVLQREFKVCIYSSRSGQVGGIDAMILWLKENGITAVEILCMSFPVSKPIAYLTIDDRAICFNGTFPTPTEMFDFKPWNRD